MEEELPACLRVSGGRVGCSVEVSPVSGRNDGRRLGEMNLSYIVVMWACLSCDMGCQHDSLYVVVGMADSSVFLICNGDSVHAPP